MKYKLKILKNRNALSIIISLFIFAFILFISSSDILFIVNKNLQKLYFEYLPKTVSKNLMIVEIDESTLAGRKLPNGTLTKKGLGRYPFDRKYFAKVIDNLNDAGAAVIGIDVIFGEESNPESDKLLSDSIKKAGNVILGLWTDSASFVEFPYEPFGRYILTKGFYNVYSDEKTKIVYSILPFKKFKNNEQVFDHFSIAVLKGFYSKIYNDDKLLYTKLKLFTDKIVFSDKIVLKRSLNLTNNELIFEKKSLIIDLTLNEEKLYHKLYDKFTYNEKSKLVDHIGNNENVLINFIKADRYYKWSFLDIYNGDFDKTQFKDKIVIIGATAQGLKDDFETPIGKLYGVYLHANLINTIMTNNGIRYINTYLELTLVFLLIIVSVYFNISRSSYVLIFSNVAMVGIFITLILFVTLSTNYLFSYTIEFIIALILSLAISNIVKYYTENINKVKLNKALSEYVSEDVAKEILSGEGKVNLNGENKEIAIFFSDIEGFTSISEKFSPEELVSFLREYLTEMSNIIMDDKGFINKYEGDAIMALWGVFLSDGQESYRICESALKQQELLKKLNEDWFSRGFSEIKIRIGIHIGNAIIGNIGAEGRKMEFTALGDSVNLASRLESVNKFYGTYICVSESIYEKQKDNFEFRYLDNIKVKGKDISVKIYELLAFKGKLIKEESDILFKYRIAINLYKNKSFIQALKQFNELVNLNDKPSITYKERCEYYIKTPPNDDWDGVWTMTSK